MLIHKTQQTILALSRILPNAFLFVIDTTDRTFLFKSKMKGDFHKMIVQFDEDFGIDKLTQDNGHYFDNYCSNIIGFKNIGTNTYLGFCTDCFEVGNSELSQAQKLVLN